MVANNFRCRQNQKIRMSRMEHRPAKRIKCNHLESKSCRMRTEFPFSSLSSILQSGVFSDVRIHPDCYTHGQRILYTSSVLLAGLGGPVSLLLADHHTADQFCDMVVPQQEFHQLVATLHEVYNWNLSPAAHSCLTDLGFMKKTLEENKKKHLKQEPSLFKNHEFTKLDILRETVEHSMDESKDFIDYEYDPEDIDTDDVDPYITNGTRMTSTDIEVQNDIYEHTFKEETFTTNDDEIIQEIAEFNRKRIYGQLKRYEKDKSYQCSTCLVVFTNLKLCETHAVRCKPSSLKRSKSVLLQCRNCDQSFTNSEELREHVKLDHFELKQNIPGGLRCHYKKCKDVRFTENTSRDLHQHLHSEHETKCSAECPYYLVERRRRLRAYEKEKKKKKVRKLLKTQHEVKKEQMAVELQTEICDECGKSFPNKSCLTQHQKGFHSLLNMPCDICGKTMKNQQSLNAHMYRMHKERIFLCPICPFQCSNGSKLRNHTVTKHEGGGSHKCSFCGKGWTCKNKLDSHIASVHTKSYPYECRYDMCKKRYNDHANRCCHERKSHGGIYGGKTQGVF